MPGHSLPGVQLVSKACVVPVCRACHNLLKAHAAAVKTYRTWYQPSQQGKIGLTTNVVWGEPLTNSAEGERRHACGGQAGMLVSPGKSLLNLSLDLMLRSTCASLTLRAGMSCHITLSKAAVEGRRHHICW